MRETLKENIEIWIRTMRAEKKKEILRTLKEVGLLL